MSNEKKKEEINPLELMGPGEMQTAQTAAIMLCRAVIDEKIGVQIFKHKATGKPVAVIGRETKVRRGSVEMSSFTPLGIVFSQRPDEVVEPYIESDGTVATQITSEIDENGRVIAIHGDVSDEEVLDAHAAKLDPTKVN